MKVDRETREPKREGTRGGGREGRETVVAKNSIILVGTERGFYLGRMGEKGERSNKKKRKGINPKMNLFFDCCKRTF